MKKKNTNKISDAVNYCFTKTGEVENLVYFYCYDSVDDHHQAY